MPTLPGVLGSSNSTTADFVRITDALASFAVDHWPPYANLIGGSAGSVLPQLPVSQDNIAVRGGVMGNEFSRDYYDRIHIVPARVDVGNVIGQTARSIEVWNAHRAPSTLGAIAPSGTTGGMTLSGPPAPPIVYAPLQSRVYTLTVLPAGDPVIDARYTFDFGAEQPQLAVTGRRIVVWNFRPDWSSGITERLAWLTDVLTAYDGTEQRVRLRDHARRSIEYAFLAHGHERRMLEALTLGWGGRLYCLPVWWEADAVTISAGATSVTVTDAALKDYRAGGLCVFYRDSGLTEAVEIQSITGNTITLRLPLANSFGAGSRVLPAVLARLDGEAPYAHWTDRVAMGRVRFEVDGNLDRTPADIGATWQGYAVLDERPDRSEDVAETWARTLQVLDYLTGIVTVDDTTGAPVIRRTYSWLLNGRASIDRWKKWASARAGRLNALWLPTFADDLELVQPAASSSTALHVRNTLSARYVGAHPLRAAVRIELASGTILHRRVTGIAEIDAQTESIAIDAALGVTIAPTDVRRMMWMSLARLNADALEIHYETDRLARLSVTFRMVQQ